MEIKEYSKKTIRLFEVDIPVHPNTPQEDPATPPESSSTPPAAVSSPISTVSSDDNNQEKHVPDQSLVPAAAGSCPSSDEVPAKSTAKKKAIRLFGVDIPVEEIPGVIETMESHNGSKPVFLYHKKLEASDVWDHLNRLSINTPEILMSFLRDEERIAVTETRKGIQCIGIDKEGRSFNLNLGRWPILQMIVINKQWSRIVNANNAVKGDWVEIWGYRVNGSDELRLVINFRKQDEIDQRMNAASSSSSSTN
ncbi:hypothetical protein ABFX02_02G127100 [Erythranthe guttata]